jgi:hypothetical protein
MTASAVQATENTNVADETGPNSSAQLKRRVVFVIKIPRRKARPLSTIKISAGCIFFTQRNFHTTIAAATLANTFGMAFAFKKCG